jgi:hypothetical protein
VGQIRLGFPVLAQMADLRASQLDRITAAEFQLGQLLWDPAVLVAIAGLYGLLASPALRPFRVLGWSCVTAFAILVLLQGKAYYAGALYPRSSPRERCSWSGPPTGWPERFSKPARLRSSSGSVSSPCHSACRSFLRPQWRGMPALGVEAATRTNTGELGSLPQDYADMLGWEQQVATVARVYHTLPAHQREQAVVVAGNYGEAGALDYYGPRYGLPEVVSPHGSYWFFGPGDRPGEVVITIGVPEADLRRFFDSVETAATVSHPWAVEEERNLTVNVGTGPRKTLQQLWPSLAGQN